MVRARRHIAPLDAGSTPALPNPFLEIDEAHMTKRILKTLKEKYPGVWYKIHGGLYQEAGIPDIIGCYKGAFFAFEVKRPGRENRVSAHQQYQLDRLRAAHATVGVVSSVAETVKIMEYIKNAI